MPDSELIPELHDIGKLVDFQAIAAAIPGWPQDWKGHTFITRRNELIDLAALGLPQPIGATWWGIVNHHDRIRKGQIADSNVAVWRGQPQIQAVADQLITLMAADHLAASTSRVTAQNEDEQRDSWPQLLSTSRLPLWRLPTKVGAAPLIQTRDQLVELLTLLSAPSLGANRVLARYTAAIETVPEEKGFPRAVTTLRTHLDLVGRYYHIMRRFSKLELRQGKPSLVYAGQGVLSRDQIEERWRFRMARCRVRIPAVPARLRDLGVFQRLESALDTLAADADRRDHLLFATFQDLWLFLPIESLHTLADVLRPVLDAGFHVEAHIREAPLTNLPDWRSRTNASFSVAYLQAEAPTEIVPPLCEVCQLSRGEIRWQRRADDVPEQLCTRCVETRERFSQRFQRLEEWTRGYAAWLRIALNLDALDDHVATLFRQYVAARGKGVIDAATQQQLTENLRTTALVVDYVNDFQAMQADFAERVQALLPRGDVEALTAERKELFIVRLDHRSDVLKLLHLCYAAALDHLPNSIDSPPFGVAVSLAPVRFPFGEHWRLLQQAETDVTVYLIGSGRLTCSLRAVPDLVAAARDRGAPRRGLHRLADLAAQSSALARAALLDREERDIAGIVPRLRTLGLDFESLAAFARLTQE